MFSSNKCSCRGLIIVAFLFFFVSLVSAKNDYNDNDAKQSTKQDPAQLEQHNDIQTNIVTEFTSTYPPEQQAVITLL